MKKRTFILIVLLVAAAAGAAFVMPGAMPARAQAAPDLTVAPAVIDGNGIPDDIFNYTLTVKNTTGRQLNVFASVYELTASGTQPFTDPASSDRPALLADWISISRGAMTFAPGETKAIPMSVTINPYATAGDYHAVIAFVEGGTRADAETRLDGAPQALVNFTVASNLKDQLELRSFGPARRFSSGFPVSVAYAVANTGDVPESPSGDVIFYDRIGHELGSVPANPDGATIAPGDTHTFTATWGGGGGGMGEYKVGLQMTYGPQDAQLADTAIFWILPWKELLAIFVALLIFVAIVASVVHRSYVRRHHRRRQAIERILASRHEGAGTTIDLKHPHRHE